MTRIHIPVSIEAAPANARPMLAAVKAKLGSVPNLFRLIANSPASLEGFLGVSAALEKGSLDARTRERIALAIAEVNRCGYCLAAHTFLGMNVARLSDAEIAANRDGHSTDAKAAAAVAFAVKVARARGRVSDEDVSAIRAAGYTDADIVEIVQHVAVNTFTNYLNEVAKTDIDFPVVAARTAA